VIRDLSDKSTMKMRNNGDVPGAGGERTCQEAVGVVDEVGNNHVNDILRKPSNRGRTCGGLWAGEVSYPLPPVHQSCLGLRSSVCHSRVAPLWKGWFCL
jgi:hypothetical protein